MQIDSELIRLGFGDTSWLWDPEKQKRLEDILFKRPNNSVPSIIVQYVWQGGARDLLEFFEGYKNQFDYRKLKGWPLPAPTPEEYKEKVRKKMLGIALNNQLQYIFCPFMKTRTMRVLDSVVHPGYSQDPMRPIRDSIEDAMCYMCEGVELKDFKMTAEKIKAREDYLRKVKILV